MKIKVEASNYLFLELNSFKEQKIGFFISFFLILCTE